MRKSMISDLKQVAYTGVIIMNTSKAIEIITAIQNKKFADKEEHRKLNTELIEMCQPVMTKAIHNLNREMEKIGYESDDLLQDISFIILNKIDTFKTEYT